MASSCLVCRDFVPAGVVHLDTAIATVMAAGSDMTVCSGRLLVYRRHLCPFLVVRRRMSVVIVAFAEVVDLVGHRMAVQEYVIVEADLRLGKAVESQAVVEVDIG